MDRWPRLTLSKVNIQTICRQHKKQLVIATAVFAFLLLILLFKWDWLRPTLVSYVSHKSHREIQLGHLDIEFSGFLNPTIKFENLIIANASWSNKRPLIHAKKMDFKLNSMQLLTNRDDKIVDIAMVDAEVNMERLRDGLRNWRLLTPDYKGPGKYKVRTLTAERSVVTFKNDALNLNFSATVSANIEKTSLVKADSNKKLPNNNLPIKITFSGSYLQSPFSGVVFSPTTITLQKTNHAFDINGYMQQAKNKISISGKVGDVIKNPLIDANITLSGNIFSMINLFKSATLTGQTAFSLSTHLYKQENQYKLNNLVAKIGGSDLSGSDLSGSDLSGSDLSGDLSYWHDDESPKFSANIDSQAIDIKQLFNIYSQLGTVNPQLKSQPSVMKNLKKAQLDVNLTIKKVKNIGPAQLSGLNMHVDGNAGKFDLKLKDAQLNGGKLSASASLNIAQTLAKSAANNALPQFQAQVFVDKLQLVTLLDSTNLDDKLSAPVNAKAKINAAGDSFDGMTKNLAGSVDVAIGKGIISNKLDAKLGLDLGKLVWLSLRGDKNIALNCGKLALDIKQGVATSNEFWVNTEQTIVNGHARVNLANRRVNVTLDPQPKEPSLFATNKSIQLSGQLAAGNLSIKTTDSTLKKSAQTASNYACNNS